MANTMYRILGKRGRITIPYEMRRRVGFSYNDVLSFTESEDGRTVLVRREKICNNCKDDPPGDSVNEVTLLEFLDGLSDSEQHAALIHLSVKWAEKQAPGITAQ
ncbi:AbrB/MazE/SpoVT family DNA-binding domain-containing protein [Hominifimenecus sp. rT4P-3]|uniref:AbrB/MazE/SpoVT family DNA-binding domain-containing protein n=1 Tax=Hominifimenecus sp. rT4P-3 TaxID=3242979 RepID=UPI003DA3E860